MDPAMAGKWICPMHGEVVKNLAGSCDVCGMPLVRTESLGYVSLKISDNDKPLVIPASAALLTGTRAIVYVKLPNKDRPTFEGREIVLGPRAGDYYIVKHGLYEGERVVTRGSFKLDAELQIQAKPSMMTPEGDGGSGMAGMDHGEKKMNPEDMQTMKSSQLSLAALTVSQLQEVGMAADKAIMTDGSMADIRKAYGNLTTALATVDKTLITGKAASLWKEYAMLLGNDSFEGINLKTQKAATALSVTAGEHLASMRKKLGINNAMSGMSHEMSAESSDEISSVFKQQLAVVIDDYLEIQTALAQDDSSAASSAAGKALTALAKVDMTLVSGDNHMLWMKESGELKTLLTAVDEADEIEPARAAFAMLSEQLSAVISSFGLPEGKLYKAWCPMAFDNRGAFWIQNKTEIANPYFGETMLNCGEIKEVLK